MGTKLLLADDSVTIQKVVSLTFAAEDVLIDAVTDGNLALERARATKPDIVLADVFMPGQSGYEVCAAIKSDPQLAGTPVVLLVGTFEPFDEIEAARVKCDAYLTKPFDTAELIQIVRDLVGQRAAKKSGKEQPASLSQARTDGRELQEITAMGLVSERARESFLGANRILDLFEAAMPAPDPDPMGAAIVPIETQPSVAAAAASAPEEEPRERQAAVATQVIPFPGVRSGGQEFSPVALSEEMVDLIVEKVVKRMSQEVVREIAWEVIPELSEIMIRQYLDALETPGKS
jgi:CheY-like chemotaxis protein